MADFDESKHPRAEDGKFTSGSGSGSAQGEKTYRQNASYDDILNEKPEEPKKKTAKEKYKSYVDWQVKQHNGRMDTYFGADNWQKVSNQYYAIPKRVLNNDEILLVTNNIKLVKGNPVMIVGNNKAIYLKDWQYKKVSNYYKDINGVMVKLNRNYFKPYEFKSDFEGFSFDKDESFDDLLETAKEQEKQGLTFKID